MISKKCFKLLNFSILLASIVFLVSCASQAPHPVFHVVDMENRGEEVYEFQIQYGDVPLPFHSGADPEFAKGGSSTFLNDMVVPVTAEVRWKTSDGTYYCPTVEIRRYVPNPDEFGGNVEFNINHDRLEVFVFQNVKMKQHRETFKPIYSDIKKCML